MEGNFNLEAFADFIATFAKKFVAMIENVKRFYNKYFAEEKKDEPYVDIDA